MDANSTFAAIADRQFGCVRRDQLVAAGISRAWIDHEVRVGRLERVAPHAYRVPGSGHHPHAELHAVLASVGGDAALARRTAAALHGLLPLRLRPPFDVTIANTRYPDHRQGVDVLRSRRFRAAEDATLIDGLRVTTIERTVFELVARDLVVDVADLVSAAIIRCGATPGSLYEQADHVGRLHGAGRVRGAVARLVPNAEQARSVPEVALAALCARNSLPPATLAHRITLEGRNLEADLAFPAFNLWIEVDSDAHHRGLATTEVDATRQNLLTTAGWLVLRFPARMIRDHPERVIAAITSALRSRGWRPPTP